MWEPEDEDNPRRTYDLGGRHGQISFSRVKAMLKADSGLTGDDIRVFFYCGIMTYEEGGATAKDTAEFLGLTPLATRRIAKKLSQHKMLLVAEVIGRTIRYRASPHIFSSLTGREQSEEAAAYHLPTLPGRPGAAPKGQPDGASKPVSRARRSSGADEPAAAPEAEHPDDLRGLGRSGTPRRAYGG